MKAISIMGETKSNIEQINDLIESKKLDKALSHCQELVKTSPDEYKYYLLLTKIYVRLGKKAEAIQTRQKALSLINKDTKAWQKTINDLASVDDPAAWYDKNTELLDAQNFVSPSRMDIVLKYLYADALFNDRQNATKIEEMYKRHINLRSEGYEPTVLWNPYTIDDSKNGLNVYLEKYKDLLKAVAKEGFDYRKWIPVSEKNNIILDGAHRVAACLLFNKPIQVCKVPYFRGKEWDIGWFRSNGFSREECNLIVRNFVGLKPSNVRLFVVWGAVIDHVPKIRKTINKTLKVFYEQGFSFSNKQAYKNFIYEIYSQQFGPTVVHKKNITKKADNLCKHAYKARVFAVYDHEAEEIQGKVDSTKKEIRQAMDGYVPEDLFMTIHSTDTDEETRYFANYFFNKNQILHLKFYGDAVIDKSFSQQLAKAKDVFDEQGIPVNETAIVGSGVLVGSGIKKKCDDIDFIMKHGLRVEKKVPMNRSFELDAGVDIVKSDYHKRSKLSKFWLDNDIIDDENNHFFHRGFKFANTHIVADNKSVGRRKKDKKDYVLIYNSLQDPRHVKRDIHEVRNRKLRKLREKPLQYFLDSKFSPFKKKK